MPENKLKPCPFCGGEAEFTPNNEPWYSVNCKGSCAHTGNRNQDYKAAAVWNNRATSRVLNFVAHSLKAMHDNAWHHEEGYDETDMCRRNIKALKAAGVAEYCGKEDEDEQNNG